MVNDCIDISKLNLDELSGVVSLYPWFAGARMELCRRMSEMGEDAWEASKYAEHALHIPSRRLVYQLLEKSRRVKVTPTPMKSQPPKPKPVRQVFVIGGDYYSQAQYDSVRKTDDNIFAAFAGEAADNAPAKAAVQEEFNDFCTEALAKIYLEQGYPDKAKEIYSKLSLRYPEKSVYFATLIEKIDKKI